MEFVHQRHRRGAGRRQRGRARLDRAGRGARPRRPDRGHVPRPDRRRGAGRHAGERDRHAHGRRHGQEAAADSDGARCGGRRLAAQAVADAAPAGPPTLPTGSVGCGMTVVLDKNSGDHPDPPGDEELNRRAAAAVSGAGCSTPTCTATRSWSPSSPSLCALVVGAILIAIADPPTRTALGYFFQHPSDTFIRGWNAIAAAYTALFRGSILNPDSLYSNGGVAIFGPISDTLLNAAPLILGGLAVAVAFRAGLFNIGVQGQLIMGAIAAGYVGFAISLPPFVHLVVAIARRHRRRRDLGRAGRLAQGGDRRARGHHDDHAQLRRGVLPRLPADPRRLPAAGLQPGDLPGGEGHRAAAAPVRRPALRHRHRARGRGRLLVAAQPLDPRLPDPGRRRQPLRGPHGGHAGGAQLHHRHGDLRRAGRAGRLLADPRHEHPADRQASTPASASTPSPSPCSVSARRSARCSPACCSARSAPAAS